MIQTDTTEEEVTTIEYQSPQQVIKKTTKQVEPQVKEGAPQKVYDTKKSIFRFNKVIWYILGLVETLLIFRIVLKLLGANPSAGFASLIYAITEPLAAPFSGILGTSTTGNSSFEWSTIIAVIVYLCIAWGVVYLLDLIYPISSKDLETK